jgi:hypothetical protein
MHKHTFLLLLIIATTTNYGMKRLNIFENDDAINTALVLFNPDLLPQITTHICSNYNYQPKKIKNDIRALSDTNKFFHNYYAQERIKQRIIDLCLPYHNSNSKDIAWALRCRAIHDKIENITEIVRNEKEEFSQDDLADAWYLSVTTTYTNDYNIYQEPFNHSLLYIAIDYWNIKKAITILDRTQKLRFDYSFEHNPLLRIAEQRARLFNSSHNLIGYDSFQGYAQPLLICAKKILNKGILPDGLTKMNQHTPLFRAVQHADKEFVQLLLEYGANPYLLIYGYLTNKKVNAFAFEPEKGWLQKIIDEVEENKKLKCETLL